jgi:hypothetical protein
VPGEQAQLDQDANWRYGAFATNLPTGTGPVPRCPSPHQAHVEDKMKEVKAGVEEQRNEKWR